MIPKRIIPSRDWRISVYQETLNVIKKGFYQTQSGNTIHLETVQPTAVQFNSPEEITYQPNKLFDTQIEVADADCIEEGIKLKEQGHSVCVLNMASDTSPGGGVLGGSAAQEENLFRRTTYSVHLNNTTASYPIARCGGVYTPKVLVLRAPEAQNYSYLDKPTELAFVAVPGLKSPPLNWEGNRCFLSPQSYQTLKTKITCILKICASFEHTAVVLSALGCGAYRSPPADVAKAFKEVLWEFEGVFQKVVFAIFDDHNARMLHNPEGNLKPFLEEFN